MWEVQETGPNSVKRVLNSVKLSKTWSNRTLNSVKQVLNSVKPSINEVKTQSNGRVNLKYK